MQKGQGAIEYLLLLVAAIVVVSVVISYMTGILDFGGSALSKETLEGLCAPLSEGGFDQNTLLCGCYLKDNTKGEKDKTGEIIMASKDNCPEKLLEKYQKEPLLTWE